MVTCDGVPLCRPRLWWLYKVYLGVYSAQLCMHLTWETRRKDFYPMLVHHIATIFLIGLSLWLG